MSMMDPYGGFAAPEEAAPQEGGGGAVEHLRQAIEHAQMAMQGEEDDQFSSEIAKAVQTLYKIMATLQKEGEAAMGVTPQHKFMARQQSGGGGGY
jgi:isopentenyl phosphate kinase